jgi:hypothetical protein
MQHSRTWIVRLVGLLVVVEIVWGIAANVLLNNGVVEALFNRRPEKFSLHWESARTWYPARVQVRGLVYEYHTRTMEMEVRTSKAAASLRILPLFALRVALDEVDTHDLAVALVREVPEGPEPVPAKTEPGFRIALEDVEVHGIESFSYNDLAITGGEPALKGDAAFQVRGPLEFSDTVIDWRDARITVGDEIVAKSISLAFRGDVGPLDPRRDRDRRLLGKISGAIDIHGHSRDLRPLHLLLPGIEWIERLDGAGDVAVHMIVDEGRLQPGTDIDVVATSLQLWFLGFAAEGSGQVRVDVSEGGGARLGEMDVVFEDFDFFRRGVKAPLARGAGFTLAARAEDFGFTEGIDGLDIALDIPGSVVPDVAHLAANLPVSLAIELTGGRATLSGHLEAHGREAEARGFLRIDGTNLAGLFRDLAFAVDLAFVTQISGRNLDAFDIQLGGTEVRLFNGVFEEGEVDVDEGWWMTLAIPDGLANLVPPVTADAKLDLSMRDSRAILAAFAEIKSWIDYLDHFLTVRDVAGTALLGIEWPRIALRDLSLAGDRLEVMAELEFEEEKSEGIFWGKLGVFRLGMERSGEEKDFKLVDSREWYEEQREARWAGRGGRTGGVGD